MDDHFKTTNLYYFTDFGDSYNLRYMSHTWEIPCT